MLQDGHLTGMCALVTQQAPLTNLLHLALLWGWGQEETRTGPALNEVHWGWTEVLGWPQVYLDTGEEEKAALVQVHNRASQQTREQQFRELVARQVG